MKYLSMFGNGRTNTAPNPAEYSLASNQSAKPTASGVLATAALSAFSGAILSGAVFCAPAAAQAIPNLTTPVDPSIFSQDLTDAVTQGFRQRDRVFFEEGNVQFEHIIDTLQNAEATEPVLVIEPVSDDWQQFETTPNSQINS